MTQRRKLIQAQAELSKFLLTTKQVFCEAEASAEPNSTQTVNTVEHQRRPLAKNVPSDLVNATIFIISSSGRTPERS